VTASVRRPRGGGGAGIYQLLCCKVLGKCAPVSDRSSTKVPTVVLNTAEWVHSASMFFACTSMPLLVDELNKPINKINRMFTGINYLAR